MNVRLASTVLDDIVYKTANRMWSSFRSEYIRLKKIII